MSETGFRVFDTTVQKTNLVLREIEEAYGWPPDRRMQSYAATRTVLHALRDRLPVEESADLAAQLPMLLRGLYYEGWNPSRVPQRMGKDEFLERIRSEFTYTISTGIDSLVRTVIDALDHHVAEGQWSDVRSTLPKEFASIFE
jgi:uncharacterized protein (DUF2267 family)